MWILSAATGQFDTNSHRDFRVEVEGHSGIRIASAIPSAFGRVVSLQFSEPLPERARVTVYHNEGLQITHFTTGAFSDNEVPQWLSRPSVHTVVEPGRRGESIRSCGDTVFVDFDVEGAIDAADPSTYLVEARADSVGAHVWSLGSSAGVAWSELCGGLDQTLGESPRRRWKLRVVDSSGNASEWVNAARGPLAQCSTLDLAGASTPLGVLSMWLLVAARRARRRRSGCG